MAELPADVPTNLGNYYLQLLRRGPNWSPEQTPAAHELFLKHLHFVRRMTEARTFVIVGPVRENDVLFGMAVLSTTSRAEAEAICAGDPAVQAGQYAVELHPVSLAGLEAVRVLFREESAAAS
jgi:uncharacterized protein YciI